jgi:hypothetical protein
MHSISDWFNNNFLRWYKPLSLLFTGAFGILGLLKNFKESRLDPATDVRVERITRWGLVSMIGIIFSTGLGIAAQRAEDESNRHKEEDTVTAALNLSKKSDVALERLARLSSPSVEGIQFSARYNLPCKEAATILQSGPPKVREMWEEVAGDCKSLQKRINANRDRLIEVNREWSLTVQFFLSEVEAVSFIGGKSFKPNLEYRFSLDCVAADANDKGPNSDITMACKTSPSDSGPSRNDGNIKSGVDLQRAAFLVQVEPRLPAFVSDGSGGDQVRDLQFTATLKGNVEFVLKRSVEEKTTASGKIYMGRLEPAEATSQSNESSTPPNPAPPNPATK